MQPRSWLEMTILAVAMAASGFGFWYRFGPVVSILRASKDDPDFKLDPIRPRIRKFVWEVLCQGLVIKERPLPGIAHAFVFWGFCAFALVTINHLAAGYGLVLIPRDSLAGAVYFGFVAVFAVAVAISILGLAARRYLVRPVWLGKVSAESGVIAVLI